MAATKVWGFNEEGFNRVLEATRRVLRTPTAGSRRRRQTPVIGGGGAGCDIQNAIIDIIVFGSPTGGTFDMEWTVNGVAETLTFNWNETVPNVATELATHTEIASADIAVSSLGTFPDATMRIEFQATLANMNIALPIADWTSLTGGTGVGVICVMAQLGHS